MSNNVKQILTSLGLIATAVISFILFAPLFVFLFIFLMIFSFFLRRKAIKENPEFFGQFKTKKGRVIDQQANDCTFSKQENLK
ncbi:hypothetical protein IB642_06700 [Allofrancisella guangzhouensis]|uniref:Uncharacterized protein n=1 Tax=Allofrancisella guangzhouensis TaxID=594679 RepID=A0A0A8E5G3_9GAMM|nr:hypothetical protein [Allofrancisella guangzhouensis]AJC48842.1 hypothetical protein SD28_03960 [Allofrancisella guangzhouensis]MBK2027257.1 hypothetical protein [Allofrancisella guangzhouensis]MBK2044711.1 hypothetical protein [Allofrancisella guangzhouensis]MBK2045947.1 hypothetical protein [Allofrancisella guangzhouensis]